jgi:hypothetical protein
MSEGPIRPWFTVLGVSADASREEIKAARDKRVRIFHSDRLQDERPEITALANQYLVEVNLAYEEALKHRREDQDVSQNNSDEQSTETKHRREDQDVSQNNYDETLWPNQELNQLFHGSRNRKRIEKLITNARKHENPLAHILLIGYPEGSPFEIGRTIAQKLNVNFVATRAADIKRAADFAALVTNLKPRDVLFIDKAHNLVPEVEEILCLAMNDFQLDTIIYEGLDTIIYERQDAKIDLPPFTVIGACPEDNQISEALREKFSVLVRPIY